MHKHTDTQKARIFAKYVATVKNYYSNEKKNNTARKKERQQMAKKKNSQRDSG